MTIFIHTDNSDTVLSLKEYTT